MSKTPPERTEHRRLDQPADAGYTRASGTADHAHDLVAVTESVPYPESTDAAVDLQDPPTQYRTRFLRCRRCGQERNDRSAFPATCEGADPHPLSEGGYTVEDPRTRRALTEAMEVQYGATGPRYPVHSERGAIYEVDLESWTCTCPDFQKRGDDLSGGCKHLRRADLEVRAGLCPDPEGHFRR